MLIFSLFSEVTPTLNNTCFETFDPDSNRYNVTFQWQLSINDCSVFGYITTFELKISEAQSPGFFGQIPLQEKNIYTVRLFCYRESHEFKLHVKLVYIFVSLIFLQPYIA